jgi:hypothetical protein
MIWHTWHLLHTILLLTGMHTSGVHGCCCAGYHPASCTCQPHAHTWLIQHER